MAIKLGQDGVATLAKKQRRQFEEGVETCKAIDRATYNYLRPDLFEPKEKIIVIAEHDVSEPEINPDSLFSILANLKK